MIMDAGVNFRHFSQLICCKLVVGVNNTTRTDNDNELL